MEEIYVYLQLIHIVAQQKPTQHCKAIIFQLKKRIKKHVEKLLQKINKKSFFYIIRQPGSSNIYVFGHVQ